MKGQEHKHISTKSNSLRHKEYQLNYIGYLHAVQVFNDVREAINPIIVFWLLLVTITEVKLRVTLMRIEWRRWKWDVMAADRQTAHNSPHQTTYRVENQQIQKITGVNIVLLHYYEPPRDNSYWKGLTHNFVAVHRNVTWKTSTHLESTTPWIANTISVGDRFMNEYGA
jgi:hypothetical protein